MNYGGCEMHLFRLLPRLNREKFEPEVFTLGLRGVLAGDLMRQGVHVYRPWIEMPDNPPSRLVRAVRLLLVFMQLCLHLAIRRPDIVHFFLPLSYLMGAPAALLSRIKVRLMSRRNLNLYQAKYPFVRTIEGYLHARVQAILGNSRQVLRELLAEDGVSFKNAGLIYNGIDVAPFANAQDRLLTRKQLGLSGETLVLIIVANLIPYKGHADLICAIERVQEHMPDDWRLLIVGRDDGIGDGLASQTRAANLEEHISFLGLRHDVPDLLNASDIGLLVSHQEGFSNALLEGMAAALPMIATDVGGNGEAVVHNKTGLIVPANDSNALGQAILRLSDDRELRSAMGAAGKARVKTAFSLDACVSNYERLYEALLSGQSVEDVSGIRAQEHLPREQAI